MKYRTKYSEDIIFLSYLKVSLGKVVKHTEATSRRVLLVSKGRNVAVVQRLEEYEKNEEERAFVKAIAQGLMDIKEGNTVTLEDAKKRFGVYHKPAPLFL